MTRPVYVCVRCVDRPYAECMLKIAAMNAQLEQYSEAIQIYERVRTASDHAYQTGKESRDR